MCVGLSAKVVKSVMARRSLMQAVPKERFLPSFWKIWSREIMLWCMQV